MAYRRHLSDFMESTLDFTFALVVRDEHNDHTFGGGYVTLRKPLTDALLEQGLDNAVLAIVRRGNNAFPRDKQRIRAQYQAAVKEDTGLGRVLEELSRGKNEADRPARRER